MNLGRDAEAWNEDCRRPAADPHRRPQFDLSSCGIHPSLALWEIGYVVARAEHQRGNARAALLASALARLMAAVQRLRPRHRRPASARPETA